MTKRALITGATKGIGLATSQLLEEKGYSVVGIARNQPKEKFPGQLFLCDLADVEATEKVLSQISRQGSIDCIVNNVGVVHPQALGEIDFMALRAAFDLNVRTAIQIVQHFLPAIKEKKWGRIVNLVSRAITGIENLTSYAAAKSGLVACTRTWARELAPFNITVNAVAPGPTDTELFRKRTGSETDAEKQVLATIPLNRLGQPSEIAAAIAFLISDEAGFITGQILHVDGGGSL